MTTRKRTPGLAGLGDPGNPAARTVTDPAPEPVPPLRLGVARLIPLLPPLEGDTETVALATLLRARCLAEVMCQTMDGWERGTPEDRAAGEYERTLLGKWREWVQALLVPTDAEWWVEHGRDGAGGVIHHALAAAADRAASA